MKNPGDKRTCDLGDFRERAPRTGFEPVTLRLTAACSTVELPRNGGGAPDAYQQRQPSIHAAAFSRQASRTAIAGWRQRRKEAYRSTRRRLERAYEREPAS